MNARIPQSMHGNKFVDEIALPLIVALPSPITSQRFEKECGGNEKYSQKKYIALLNG